MEIISLKKKLKRRHSKLDTIEEQLRATRMSTDHLTSLKDQFPGLLGTLVQNQLLASKIRGKKGIKYSDEMRKFAVTLHFYSPRAYLFIRKHLHLPHPNTLGTWMDGSDCGPGFNLRVLSRIVAARSQANDQNALVDVSLMIDEMATKKERVWCPSLHRMIGSVDFGTGEAEGKLYICVTCLKMSKIFIFIIFFLYLLLSSLFVGDTTLAGNCMVAMICGITGGWKCPIGWIATDKINGSQIRSFVNKAFVLLEEHGFNVLSLTSDGCPSNVAAFKDWGVVEDPKNPDDKGGPPRYVDIVNDFPNPANKDKKIRAVYDVVHMIKLWRNLFRDAKQVQWKEGGIDFKYIELLKTLQEKEQILAANKVSQYHIDFQKHKMKVRYAVQVLSRSVADALTFCRVDMNLPEFAGSKPTEDFIRALDQFFDICNSRHPKQPCWKAPISKFNMVKTVEFLEGLAEDILNMTCVETTICKGVPKHTTKFLCRSLRKRAAIGSVISMKSLIQISVDLLYRDVNPYKYVLTYRFSQDPLELTFNKIRGRLGHNNNPNQAEFRTIMKHLWHSNWLKSTSTGNCIELIPDDEIPCGMLPLGPKKKVVADPEPVIEDFDITKFSDAPCSQFYQNCLTYIAGNVIRSIAGKLKCADCIEGLFNNPSDPLSEDLMKLIVRKNYVAPNTDLVGPTTNRPNKGLLIPCRSVLTVIQKADMMFRNIVLQEKCPVTMPNLDLKISIFVTRKCLEMNLFPHLKYHVLDFDPTTCENHFSLLIKRIVSHFLKIRLFNYAKTYQKEKVVSTRHDMNKKTLFRHE